MSIIYKDAAIIIVLIMFIKISYSENILLVPFYKWSLENGSVCVFISKERRKFKRNTYPITTIIKSRIFHPFRRYAPACNTNPYAIIFIAHSNVKITRKTYSTFSCKDRREKKMLLVILYKFAKTVIYRICINRLLKRLKWYTIFPPLKETLIKLKKYTSFKNHFVSCTNDWVLVSCEKMK